MENTDTTLLEMQQQLQQLKDKLNSQKIVNERILRKSCSMTASRLRFKSNLPILFGVAAILMSPSLYTLGVSVPFLIFNAVLMLICIVATILTNRHIPSVDSDMVTAAEGLSKYKKIHAEWIKFGLPMAFIWIGLLVWETIRHGELEGPSLYGFLTGVAIGIVLGLLVGFKLRRDQLDAADELLHQLQELKEN
jgi:hypothetical protein